MGSKGQNHAIARGPPESAEGRSRGKGKEDCFALNPKSENECVEFSKNWFEDPHFMKKCAATFGHKRHFRSTSPSTGGCSTSHYLW